MQKYTIFGLIAFIFMGVSMLAYWQWFTIDHNAPQTQSPEALLQQGLMYQIGRSESGRIRINIPLAMTYFKQAAALGQPDAMYFLGVHYEIGSKFLVKDIPKAKIWYHKAAELGNIPAKQRLLKFN